MDSHYEDIRLLAKEFENCRKILLALGDENRQHLILEMLKMEQRITITLMQIWRQ